jgi:hypothetical protein
VKYYLDEAFAQRDEELKVVSIHKQLTNKHFSFYEVESNSMQGVNEI